MRGKNAVLNSIFLYALSPQRVRCATRVKYRVCGVSAPPAPRVQRHPPTPKAGYSTAVKGIQSAFGALDRRAWVCSLANRPLRAHCGAPLFWCRLPPPFLRPLWGGSFLAPSVCSSLGTREKQAQGAHRAPPVLVFGGCVSVRTALGLGGLAPCGARFQTTPRSPPLASARGSVRHPTVLTKESGGTNRVYP